MSRRDLVHVLDALLRLSGETEGAGVAVEDIDAAIGRGHGDMRTPLNLQSLADQGHASRLVDGTWTPTAQGSAWRAEDRELSGG